MRDQDRITFSGASLDRAGGLRGRPEDLAVLSDQPGTRVLPLWRGKVLVAGPRPTLGLLHAAHPLLDEPGEPPVFLGLTPEGAVFAQDVSGWTPAGDAADPPSGFFDTTEQHHPALAPEQRFTELRGAMAALTALEAEIAATARALTGWHRSHGFCARCGQPSVPAQAGWQRNCPACGTHHFPRTDPVVIMLVTHGNSLLLGRSPAWPERMYSLLAGFIEPGETLEGAVRREVFEETGVRIGAVRYLAGQPWPFPANLMLGCHAEALTTALTLDPAEIEDALWLTREEVAEVMAGSHASVSAPRPGAIAHFLTEAWLADRLD